jgi:hypothetical protein
VLLLTIKTNLNGNLEGKTQKRQTSILEFAFFFISI